MRSVPSAHFVDEETEAQTQGHTAIKAALGFDLPPRVHTPYLCPESLRYCALSHHEGRGRPVQPTCPSTPPPCAPLGSLSQLRTLTVRKPSGWPLFRRCTCSTLIPASGSSKHYGSSAGTGWSSFMRNPSERGNLEYPEVLKAESWLYIRGSEGPERR